MPQLRISVLGGFQAHLADSPVVGFQSDKARALLVYLVVEADRPHSRSQLAGLLWPDIEEKRARAYLRHALANLRQILGDAGADEDVEQPFLLVTPQTLQFNQQSHHRLDVADLLAGLNALPTSSNGPLSSDHLARAQAAVAGGERPFLDGFSLGDCPAFEEWLLLNRERVQRQVLAALHHLADGYEQAGELARACIFARQCIVLEPWQEESHRQVMRLLAQSGQRSAALVQYETCRRLLHAELNIEPSPETTALHRAILSGKFDEALPPTTIARTHAPPRHNLPTPTTPLVGRDETIRAVQHLFTDEQARLVTLTGPGGVGKTRLGLAAAWAMLADFSDGVYFVELAPVRDGEFVLPAIAEALGVRNTSADRPLGEAVLDYLRRKRILLLLDNFEHLVSISPVLAELLAGAPHLKIVVTSRTLLRLRGEFEFVVPPLSVAESEGAGQASPANTSTPTNALELFRQRARAANHSFVLDQTNITQAAQICARLDGLPLAIELAAARLKYSSLPALLASLTSRQDADWLRSLKTDLRDTPERQRSLWATIAWSYDLLGAEEQILFRRLAVFVGGWTAEAAEAVCGEGLEVEAQEGLTALVDTHLIFQIQDAPSGPRYGMLETIREFGLAQLQQKNELAAMQRRHTDYFRELVVRLEPETRTHKSVQTLAYLHLEYPNIRVALAWAIGQKNVEICLSFGHKLLSYWNQYGEMDAQGYLDQILTVAEDAPPSTSYVHTLVSAGYMAFGLGKQPRGRSYFERAIAMNQAIGERGNVLEMGIAYGLLTTYQEFAGEYEAAYASREAILEWSRRAGDDWNLAITLANTGVDVARRGQFERAAALIDEGLALFRRIGDPWGIGIALFRRAVLYRMTGDFAQAKHYFGEVIELGKEASDGGHTHSAKMHLAMIAGAEGDDRTAAQLLLEILKDVLDPALSTRAVEVLGILAQLTAKNALYADALKCAGVVANFYAQRNLVLPPIEKREQEEVIALARSHLSAEAADAAWQTGESMRMEDAVAYAERILLSMSQLPTATG